MCDFLVCFLLPRQVIVMFRIVILVIATCTEQLAQNVGLGSLRNNTCTVRAALAAIFNTM